MDTIEELSQTTSDLIAFRTTANNDPAIASCMDYIKSYFSGVPVTIAEHASAGKPSLVISYEPKKDFRLLLNGHIDVVEGKDEQFKPYYRNGKLYGRGAVDMKAGVAAFMKLMKEHSADRPDIALMLVADEETDGANGTGYLVGKGYSAGFVIAGEPNSIEDALTLDIIYRQKGVLWLRLIAHGTSAHGSTPWLGSNAIDKLIGSYCIIRDRFPETTPEDRWKNTINIGRIHGGRDVNSLAEYAEMDVDMRFTNLLDQQQIFSLIRKQDLEVQVLSNAPPLENKDLAGIALLQDSAERVQRIRPRLLSEHGGSDLTYFSPKNIPAVDFGPSGANCHAENEYVILDTLKLFYDIMDEHIKTLVSK